MGPEEAQAAARKVRLLCEADRLLGVRDWPVSRSSLTVSAPLSPATGEELSIVAKRSNQSVPVSPAKVEQTSAVSAVDAGLKARLETLVREFPSQLDPVPGADAEARPDPMFSAHYALKGSSIEVVQRKALELAQQCEQVKMCKKCGLYDVSTQSVFGVGHPDARIVFVGEAPGADEDRTGFPFVGRAGQLLTAMIEKGMGLRREHVYICNIVKHRPPENRIPAPDEIAACQEHLWWQLRLLEPHLIVTLGLPATQTLLRKKESMARMRGEPFEIYLTSAVEPEGPAYVCVPTYHPAYLLRNPADKRKTWEDLKKVMSLTKIPTRA